MTKRELIDEVNRRFPHLSRFDSEVIINSIFDSMVNAMEQEERRKVIFPTTFFPLPLNR